MKITCTRQVAGQPKGYNGFVGGEPISFAAGETREVSDAMGRVLVERIPEFFIEGEPISFAAEETREVSDVEGKARSSPRDKLAHPREK